MHYTKQRKSEIDLVVVSNKINVIPILDNGENRMMVVLLW
jgi:hypothetical protein